MNFISRLMPREGRFFSLFDSHANLIMEGANALVDVLRRYEDHSGREAGARVIDNAERAADRITHETIQLLHKTFITPFDRDQIHKLINTHGRRARPDPGLGRVDRALRRAARHARGDASSRSCCMRAASACRAAVKLMAVDARTRPAMLKICEEIDKLESDADRVMRAAMSQAVPRGAGRARGDQAEGDLRAAGDRHRQCEDVANVIEGIVLENS